MPKETEIKLPVTDIESAIQAVQKQSAVLLTERHLEDNLLFDQQDNMLSKQRKLLRMRIITAPGSGQELKTILTFKDAPQTTDDVKEREEIECEVSGGNNLQEIFSRLGYRITFRYQKYRMIFQPEDVDLHICVDETPIGNFLELEGEILRIHEYATKLGYNRDDYITQSYATLYYRWCQKTGSKEPFMLFQ